MVEERDCVVCRTQKGEREADKVKIEDRLILGKLTPVEVSSINVDYIDEGYERQHPLCDYHQRMADVGRSIYLFHPPSE